MEYIFWVEMSLWYFFAGHLLYYLQQALTISLLFKSSRAMRAINSQADLVSSTKPVNSGNKEVLSCDELKKKFFEIILARREVLEIFAVTKDNSVEKEMLKAVQRDSIEMKLLKNFFKTHQNINWWMNVCIFNIFPSETFKNCLYTIYILILHKNKYKTES